MNQTFKSLLRADFTVQWRNRRASLMSLLLPLVLLVAWRPVALRFGGPFVMASCITFGLVSVGLMGYSTTTARDREKGVFQRLRTTPASTLQIMGSRLTVQLAQMAFMTLLVFVVAGLFDKITLTTGGYVLTLIIALVSCSVYLGLGQAIVGLIASAETINSVSRLVYIAFVVLGILGGLGVLGQVVAKIIQWSPYGTVQAILSAAMRTGGWTGQAWLALVITLAYAALFAGAGIKWFKWSTQ